MKSKTDTSVVKRMNKSIVRQALRTERQATKQRISQVSGLSVMTVGTIIKEFESRGEEVKSELKPSEGGRPAQVFNYNAEYAHALIIFTHVKKGQDTVFSRVINLFGEVVWRKEESIVNIELTSFEPMVDKAIELYPTIQVIGFGLPGTSVNGIVKLNDYDNLNGTNLTFHYEEKYNLPVNLENDVNLAVLGHSVEVSDSESVVYLYFPEKYDPGAGIYINGGLQRGAHGMAGEIKYLPIGVDWSSLDYRDCEMVGEAISKMVLAMIYLIDPVSIILSGEFLTKNHLVKIKEMVAKSIRPEQIPSTEVSLDFNHDYEQGLVAITVESLINYYQEDDRRE